MSLDPHNLLAKVHPDLAKVLEATTQALQPFQIVCGLRTPEAEHKAVATGHSQTMHSRHLPNAHGLACAVDIMALTDGHADWGSRPYAAIAAEIKAEAKRQGVPIEWGGDWFSLKDFGHFQLSWKDYP